MWCRARCGCGGGLCTDDSAFMTRISGPKTRLRESSQASKKEFPSYHTNHVSPVGVTNRNANDEHWTYKSAHTTDATHTHTRGDTAHRHAARHERTPDTGRLYSILATCSSVLKGLRAEPGV